jgi:thiol-disulfide isomerase/thioredoxin
MSSSSSSSSLISSNNNNTTKNKLLRGGRLLPSSLTTTKISRHDYYYCNNSLPKSRTITNNSNNNKKNKKKMMISKATVIANDINKQNKRGELVKVNMNRIDAKVEWWTKDASPNMIDITGTPQLLEQLCNNQDKLVVVDVYAKWCGACRALYPKLCKMGRQFDGNTIILKVNFDENKAMCKSLGVKVLPYMIMYKGSQGRVEEFSVSISKIKMLREKLEMHTLDIPMDEKEECNLAEFGDSVWGDEEDDISEDAPRDAEGAVETNLSEMSK